MNRSTAFVLATIVFVCVALALAVGRGKTARPGHDDARELLAAIDRVAATQTDLSERMDRLEYRVGASGGVSARPWVGNPSGATLGSGTDQNGRNLSSADRAAQLATSLHALDDQLVLDPLSPSWASANEKVIGNFLSPDSLSRQQLPAPRDFKAQCHSHLCKISMVFPDEAQASQTESMLLMEIAAGLPNAQTLLLPRPDGSVEMVVFAGDAQAFRRP